MYILPENSWCILDAMSCTLDLFSAFVVEAISLNVVVALEKHEAKGDQHGSENDVSLGIESLERLKIMSSFVSKKLESSFVTGKK